MDLPIVKRILDMHWDWKIPVDIEDIARKLGVHVHRINPFNQESLQYISCSGVAEIDTNGQRLIYSNSADSAVRQRFTLAHELGHHVLGHVTSSTPQFRDNGNDMISSTNQWLESQANNFAAQVLMPFEAIRYMVTVKGDTDISQLASTFNVSESAMYYRLKNSGLLTY